MWRLNSSQWGVQITLPKNKWIATHTCRSPRVTTPHRHSSTTCSIASTSPFFFFKRKIQFSNSKIQCDTVTVLLWRWTVMMEALSMASVSFPTISVSRSRWNSNYRPIKCASQSLPLVDNADKFLEASKKGNVIPLYRCIFSDHLTPVLAYRCLVKEDERDAPSFLFESAEPGLHVSSTVSYFNSMKHKHQTRHTDTLTPAVT